ncbi:Uncharacterised protein [Vibrio cholerae]|nr:Uncharacterised protein [Vibrio cholerae]CSC62304.1 Uncharacterised protein [Vibrio cholerae]CSC70225.1 Uncharacterised protein [Vibrio cholerae]
MWNLGFGSGFVALGDHFNQFLIGHDSRWLECANELIVQQLIHADEIGSFLHEDVLHEGFFILVRKAAQFAVCGDRRTTEELELSNTPAAFPCADVACHVFDWLSGFV